MRKNVEEKPKIEAEQKAEKEAEKKAKKMMAAEAAEAADEAEEAEEVDEAEEVEEEGAKKREAERSLGNSRYRAPIRSRYRPARWRNHVEGSA